MARIEAAAMICGSITSDNSITYGGVDKDGTMTPSARRRSVWDEEEK